MRMFVYVLLLGGFLAFTVDISAAECKEGHGTSKLPDSSVYEGEFRDCLFHGEGKLIWRDGSVFEGKFYKGLRSGFGKHKSSAGWMYEGNYKDGLAHGKGIYVYLSGDRYEGEFQNGEFNGSGKFISSKGDNYQGHLKMAYIMARGLLHLQVETRMKEISLRESLMEKERRFQQRELLLRLNGKMENIMDKE